MQAEKAIQEIVQGRPREGWVIFPYGKSQAIFQVIWASIFALFFIAGGYVSVGGFGQESLRNSPVNQGYGYLLFFLAFIFLIVIVFAIKKILNHKRYFIALTDDSLISLYGKTMEQYYYKDIQDLQMGYSRYYGHNPGMFFPRTAVIFYDTAKSKPVNISLDLFGRRTGKLYHLLQSKLP